MQDAKYLEINGIAYNVGYSSNDYNDSEKSKVEDLANYKSISQNKIELLENLIGGTSVKFYQGGIDAEGNEDSSDYWVRSVMLSNFELLVNSGYNIAYIAIYNLDGSFRNRLSVGANPLIQEDPNSFYKVVIFKGNQPDKNIIRPSENIVADFKSGIYKTFGTIIEGDVDNEKSARHAALQVATSLISKLPDEEDLTVKLDGETQIMKFANRSALVKNNKVSSLGYVILRKDKSFVELVVDANTIYEIRYEFDLNGKEVEIPVNCTLKFNGGKINNGALKGKETTIESQLSQILNSVILKGTWANDYFYPEWLGANGDDNINDTDAIQLLINAEVNIKLLAKKYKANVTWNSRSSIIGSGQDKTILEPFDNSKPVILVDVQTNTSSYAPLAYTNRILSDLTIHSGLMDAVVSVPTGVGVQMSVEGGKSNVGVIEFTRCAIVGFEYGIKKSYGGLGGNIVNCNFDKNNFHYYAYATASTSHSGCTLFHKNHFMRSYKAAIYIEYTAAIGGGQDIFDNNIFEHNRGFIFFIKGFKSSTTEMRITNNWFEENSLGNFVEKNPNDISIYDFDPVEINGETYDLAEIYLESSSGIVVENCLLRALTLKSSKITLDSVTPTTSQRYNIPREFVLVKDNDSEVLYKNAVCGTSVIETIVDSQIKLGLSTGSVATNIVADSIKNMPAGRTPSIFRVKNKTRKKALVNSADSAILASSVANVLPFSYNYSTSMPVLNGTWKPMTVIEDNGLLNKNYNRAIITAGNTGGFLRGCSVTLDSNIYNYYVIVLSIKSDNPTSPLYIAFGNNAGIWINSEDISSEWRTFAVLCNATNWRTNERTGNIVVYTGKYNSEAVKEDFTLDITYLNVVGFNKAEDALSYVNGDYIIDNDMTAEIGTYNTLPTQVTTGKQVYDKDLSKPVIWNGTEWSDALDRKANNVDDSKPMGMGYKVLSPNKSFSEQVTEANTIYEIRYNFDLQGGIVTLKDNCTLKFNGGKLTNFKNLTLSNTIIEAQREHIFEVGEMLNKGVIDATEPSENCNGEFESSITGTIKNNKIYPEWFGAVADGNTDNSDAIQYAFNTAYSIGGEIEFNGSAKKAYKVAHTIFLPPNVKMTTKNAMPIIYNENYGSRNRAEINFICRYLFRTKKNKNTDAESTRLTNKVCVEMSGLKISGVYSRPKITIDGTAETGYETEIKINGDPFWVRKTYVFYGVHFAKSRISDIVTIYIGTFIYGGVTGGSLITRNNIAFHRAFIAGMKAAANNSTSKSIGSSDIIGGSSDKPLYELGYDTTITYSDGRTYAGYIEEVPALNNVGGIIDSRITHNYLNGNKDRVICFYEVQLAMSGVNNNYIDFCFAVFFQRAALNTRCVTVSNNIIDYCLMFCVINYAGALITENQVNKMNYSEVVNKYVRGAYDEDTTNFTIFEKNVLNYKASFIVCNLLRSVDVVNNSFYDTDAMNNFTGGQFWTSVHIKDNGYYNTPNDVICIKGADGSYGMNPCSDIYFDCFANVQVDEGYIYDKKIVPYELLTVGSRLKMNTTYPSDIIDKEYNSKYEYINGELTVKNGKLNASITPAALIIPGSRGICYNEDTKVWGYVNRLTTETYGHPYMPNGIRARKGVGDTRPNTAGFNDDDIGFVFFDKSIGKPVWWNGTAWVDSAGVEV